MNSADLTSIAVYALIGAPLIAAAIITGVFAYTLVAKILRRRRTSRHQRTMGWM